MALHCSPPSLIWSIPVVVKNQQPNLSRCGKTAYRNFTNCTKKLFIFPFCSVFDPTKNFLLLNTPCTCPHSTSIPFLHVDPSFLWAQTCFVFQADCVWDHLRVSNKPQQQKSTTIYTVQGEMASTALDSLLGASFPSTSTKGLLGSKRFLPNFSLGSQHWYVSHFKLLSYHLRGFGISGLINLRLLLNWTLIRSVHLQSIQQEPKWAWT